MPIITNFKFRHQFAPAPSGDLLGPLRGFVGEGNLERRWRGTGFNLIWRPNFSKQFGDKDFCLELNLTDETLEFRDITGSAIANRGSVQGDVALGGLGYLQTIVDRIDNSPQHFEPGVWANVPKTDNPHEDPTVVRMGSIPHGTTINLQDTVFTVPRPQFDPASIRPFLIGSPDDGQINLQSEPEETITNTSQSRTSPLPPGLDQPHLTNPNLFLSAQTVLSTTVLSITSDTTVPNSVPNLGGGVDNIAFLTGTDTPPPGQPNATVSRVTATFWIEEITGPLGNPVHQLQYT